MPTKFTEENSRKCTLCKVRKLLTSFYKDRTKPKNKSYYCKLCNRLRDLRKKEYYAKYRRTEAYKKIQKASKEKHYQEHKHQIQARILARKNKKTIKKNYCEKCNTINAKLHMHHPDYSKPLQVITLCVGCHEQEHHAYKYD